MDDTIPLFNSDDLSHYENASLKTYGIREAVKRTGKRGRQRKPKITSHPDLKYAKVKKKRRKGKVVEIKTEVVFGDENKIMEAIERSPVSKMRRGGSWMQRTSVMAAGITDHIWTVEELFTFRTRQENGDLMEVGH
jgi:hypothetical protein